MEEHKEIRSKILLSIVIICCVFVITVIIMLEIRIIKQKECNCVYDIQYINQDKRTSKYIEIEAPCDRWDNNDTLILIKK